MLVFRLISGDHHGLGLSQTSGPCLSGSGLLALMFVLDVSIKGRVAEISLAADADVVALHGVIPGPSLPPGYKLILALINSLL